VIHPIEDYVSDGETRRAIVTAITPVGDSAIVEFAECDRPGTVHQAAVLPDPALAGLARGDECSIRYRMGQGIANPAHIWELVENHGPSLAAAPIPAPAPPAPTHQDAMAKVRTKAEKNRQLALLAPRLKAVRVEPPPDPIPIPDPVEAATSVNVVLVTYENLMITVYT
jgi:hypothetical protein